jgi:hypothetical protein
VLAEEVEPEEIVEFVTMFELAAEVALMEEVELGEIVEEFVTTLEPAIEVVLVKKVKPEVELKLLCIETEAVELELEVLAFSWYISSLLGPARE